MSSVSWVRRSVLLGVLALGAAGAAAAQNPDRQAMSNVRPPMSNGVAAAPDRVRDGRHGHCADYGCPTTRTGVDRSTVVPSPSWPATFQPQQ